MGERSKIEPSVRAKHGRRDMAMMVGWYLGIAFLNHLLPLQCGGYLLLLAPAWVAAEKKTLATSLPLVLLALLLHIFSANSFSGSFWELGAVTLVALVTLIRVNRHTINIKAMRSSADRDPLTGAFTRTAIEKMGEQELTRCVNDGRPFSLAVVDCDRFKQINDVHGHLFGDEVLRCLVKCIQGNLGKRCHIGRTGGDEFLVIFPGVTVTEARSRLEHAAQAFGDITLIRGAKATFSDGISESSTNGIFWNRLVETADQDMYRRKAARSASKN